MSCHLLQLKAGESNLGHVCTAKVGGGSGGNLIREKIKKQAEVCRAKAWNWWRGTCCITLFDVITCLWKPELASGPIIQLTFLVATLFSSIAIGLSGKHF